MLQRTSIVNRLEANTLLFSSVIEIGDANYIQGFSRALAVQRESEIFFGNEGSFDRFPVFSKPIFFNPFEEDLTMFTEQLHPVIKVDYIDITGVSAASIIHIGSSNHVFMESRIKHIRQLLKKD